MTVSLLRRPTSTAARAKLRIERQRKPQFGVGAGGLVSARGRLYAPFGKATDRRVVHKPIHPLRHPSKFETLCDLGRYPSSMGVPNAGYDKREDHR
jgi:hypothetical protein